MHLVEYVWGRQLQNLLLLFAKTSQSTWKKLDLFAWNNCLLLLKWDILEQFCNSQPQQLLCNAFVGFQHTWGLWQTIGYGQNQHSAKGNYSMDAREGENNLWAANILQSLEVEENAIVFRRNCSWVCAEWRWHQEGSLGWKGPERP